MKHFARKQRQIKNLAERISQDMQLNYGVVTAKTARLIRRFQKAYATLRGAISARAFRKLAAGLALILVAAEPQAQSFAPTVLDPHGLSGAEGIPIWKFDFADLDLDGDLDLFSRTQNYPNEFRFAYQENNGTPQVADFLPIAEPFGNLTIDGFDDFDIVGGNGLGVADLDGDGDFDVLTVDRLCTGYMTGSDTSTTVEMPVAFFENLGTAESPEFVTGQLNPFGLNLEPVLNQGILVQSIALVDLDGDDDLDLIGTGGQFSWAGTPPPCSFFWCENSGSAQAPQFESAVEAPFGLPGMPMPFEAADALGRVLSLDFVDFDADGDFDMMAPAVGSMPNIYNVSTDLKYYENTGTANEPDFSVPPVSSPFGLEMAELPDRYGMKFADIDSDGDEDAFHSKTFAIQYDPYEMTFQENTTPAGVFGSNPVVFATDFVTPNVLSIGDEIRIDAPWEGAFSFQFQVIDMAGRTVHAGQSTSTSLGSTSDWLPGQYIVRLIHDAQGSSAVAKMVLRRSE